MKRLLENLYDSLIAQAKRYPQYNFREFMLRKIDRDWQNLEKAAEEANFDVSKFQEQKQEELEQLQRMTKLQELYSHHAEKLVIEKPSEKSSEKPSEKKD